jgi:hypothetical protein
MARGYVERLLASRVCGRRSSRPSCAWRRARRCQGLVVRAEKPSSAKPVSASWLSAAAESLSAAALPEPVIQCRKHELSRHRQQPPYPLTIWTMDRPPYHAGLINAPSISCVRLQPTMSSSVPPWRAIVAVWPLGDSQKRLMRGSRPAHARSLVAPALRTAVNCSRAAAPAARSRRCARGPSVTADRALAVVAAAGIAEIIDPARRLEAIAAVLVVGVALDPERLAALRMRRARPWWPGSPAGQ